MADKQESVSSMIQAIPFGELIGGPLSACITAQADAAQAALDYVKTASMKRLDNGDNDAEAIFEPETVSFSFVMNGQTRVMIVPLLTILPVPFIRIEHVDLSFTADITTCNKDQIKAKFTAPRRESEEEEVAEVQTENLIEVDIHAVTSEMPSGLARLLEVFNTQLFQVEDLTEEEVEKIRQSRLIEPVQMPEQEKPNPEQEKPKPEPEKPIRTASESEKKKARDSYEASLKTGDANAVRKARKLVIATHTAEEARQVLRSSKTPDPNIPWLIRVTQTLKDNQDCEYDRGKSLNENIWDQERLQRRNRKKLRADLIFALKLARKMYPNTTKNTTGKQTFNKVWKAHTHFKNGWYTFGGAKDTGALELFVNWVVEYEKTFQEARQKLEQAQQKAQQTVQQVQQAVLQAQQTQSDIVSMKVTSSSKKTKKK